MVRVEDAGLSNCLAVQFRIEGGKVYGTLRPRDDDGGKRVAKDIHRHES
jgi:hypothetical protein